MGVLQNNDEDLGTFIRFVHFVIHWQRVRQEERFREDRVGAAEGRQGQPRLTEGKRGEEVRRNGNKEE